MCFSFAQWIESFGVGSTNGDSKWGEHVREGVSDEVDAGIFLKLISITGADPTLTTMLLNVSSEYLERHVAYLSTFSSQKSPYVRAKS